MTSNNTTPLGMPGILASVAGQAPPVANSPANQIGDTIKTNRTRIPMSVPQRKMESPELPGFHLHWFLDRNVPRALQGGYEFVKDTEVSLNQTGVATSRLISGNASLGTDVKIVAGRDEAGNIEYQCLMKIRMEWWQEDQRVLEKRNASIMSAIFTKETILGSEQVSAEDRQTRYVSQALFNRPTRKA